jgi:GH15 family glucan-1,4-alpha-glucosidase
MESTANEMGYLPEQVPATLNDPSFYQPWLNRWGNIATPLLWSHANYLILNNKLEK